VTTTLHALSQQAFYQMAVRRFAATPRLELAAAVDVQQFARAALDLPEAEWTPEDG
jgi:DNA mismatch repair protein Mlh1 C-terminus